MDDSFRFQIPLPHETVSYRYFVKSFFVILVFVLSEAKYANNDQLYEDFYKFVSSQNRPYIKNMTEMHHRFLIFKENVERARVLNNDLPSGSQMVYGINKFADWSPEEFKEKYLSGYKQSKAVNKSYLSIPDLTDFLKLKKLPPKVDWRDKGVINPVMDQGTCGACWAFSVVETIESMYAIRKNVSAPSLSVQELIDCDTYNRGCQGGDIKQACEWSLQNGVVWSDEYPLTDKNDTCHKLSPSLPRVRPSNCTNMNYSSNESQLLEILAYQGPVAVGIDATTWHNYIGGIIQFHCYDYLNHAVQIVGYNLEGEVPYYIIRNSWGSSFGDHGYIYVKYGKNLCGLATDVTSLDINFKGH